jgi:hypothetical protein
MVLTQWYSLPPLFSTVIHTFTQNNVTISTDSCRTSNMNLLSAYVHVYAGMIHVQISPSVLWAVSVGWVVKRIECCTLSMYITENISSCVTWSLSSHCSQHFLSGCHTTRLLWIFTWPYWIHQSLWIKECSLQDSRLYVTSDVVKNTNGNTGVHVFNQSVKMKMATNFFSPSMNKETGVTEEVSKE